MLAVDEEDFIARRLKIKGETVWLIAKDPAQPDFEVTDLGMILGRITYAVHPIPQLPGGT